MVKDHHGGWPAPRRPDTRGPGRPAPRRGQISLWGLTPISPTILSDKRLNVLREGHPFIVLQMTCYKERIAKWLLGHGLLRSAENIKMSKVLNKYKC